MEQTELESSYFVNLDFCFRTEKEYPVLHLDISKGLNPPRPAFIVKRFPSIKGTLSSIVKRFPSIQLS